jgi:hypothetical protein
MQTGISPTAAMWLNVAFLIFTGIAAGSVTFVGMPDYVVSIIKSIATDAAFAIAAINTVFHAYSSQAGGPMIKGTTE